ncbi:thiamine-phosphate pyrophosphorylase [Lachnotalea glycerini]|uniref:Thiamine phosphate synthase n=2 Tax=Lachnotalea glycerini TaxID=1763509 RepID=A0A318EXK9_9FIRM|nr:thiamine-phosphate pyrophosphorylase [Lachnotalea glycerini]RDY32969.1 thiamine phosphate synthase [Lachnotalea glycerini]
MIIFMSDVICITNRLLAGKHFLLQLDKIASTKPKYIILREKDLSEKDYEMLAKKVLAICSRYDVKCVIHTYSKVALALNTPWLHLTLYDLKKLEKNEKVKFKLLSTSIHSREEAVEAQKLGCHSIIAGHIFETDCKKSVPPKGLNFLEDVCKSVEIPVYAIGGITNYNKQECIQRGAAGVCAMSLFMKCHNPEILFS